MVCMYVAVGHCDMQYDIFLFTLDTDHVFLRNVGGTQHVMYDIPRSAGFGEMYVKIYRALSIYDFFARATCRGIIMQSSVTLLIHIVITAVV